MHSTKRQNYWVRVCKKFIYFNLNSIVWEKYFNKILMILKCFHRTYEFLTRILTKCQKPFRKVYIFLRSTRRDKLNGVYHCRPNWGQRSKWGPEGFFWSKTTSFRHSHWLHPLNLYIAALSTTSWVYQYFTLLGHMTFELW